MKPNFPAPSQQALIHSKASQLSEAERNYIDQKFDVISWDDPKGVEIICPGADLHTTRTSSKNTLLFTDVTPHIHCFHESCRDVVAEANRKLRDSFHEIRFNRTSPGTLSSRTITHHPIASGNDRLKEAADRSKQVILEEYACSLESLCQSSPYRIPSDPIDQFRLQLSTLPLRRNETIFHGGLKDSGHERNRSNFLLLDEAVSLPEHLGEFISQSAFTRSCFQRTRDNFRSRLVYVVECDDIDEAVDKKLSRHEELTADDKRRNKEASCAVFRWLKEAVKMRLLWVVDSGNKSLHAAFEVPTQEVQNELKVILPALGADSKMLSPSQLTRAAGARRDGDGPIQKLLYCDPIKS